MIEPGAQALLLRLVQEGGGRLSARNVDVRFSHLHEPTGVSVLQMLKELESQQLVVRETRPGAPNDRWDITASGQRWLASNGEERQ